MFFNIDILEICFFLSFSFSVFVKLVSLSFSETDLDSLILNPGKEIHSILCIVIYTIQMQYNF